MAFGIKKTKKSKKQSARLKQEIEANELKAKELSEKIDQMVIEAEARAAERAIQAEKIAAALKLKQEKEEAAIKLEQARLRVEGDTYEIQHRTLVEGKITMEQLAVLSVERTVTEEQMLKTFLSSNKDFKNKSLRSTKDKPGSYSIERTNGNKTVLKVTKIVSEA